MVEPVIFGPPDPGSLEQIRRCSESEDAVGAVLCADHHLGYSMPIGGVVAYEEHISPSGVGYDIGCGNMAVRTDLTAAQIDGRVETIAGDIERRISFGMGRKNPEPVEHEVLDAIRDCPVGLVRGLADLAARQLGTVGGGNHYVDLLADEEGHVWVGVHFGSRGFGHRVASHFMSDAGGMHAPPTLLHQRSGQGEAYLIGMELAGRYAYAGRETVVAKVLDILGADVTDVVHNHHNYAWREAHHGRDCWVVRKGATPAFPGQRGFVGGSMGEISVILRGADSALSEGALYSTVHGAGRRMSRSEAKGKVHRKTGRVIRAGRIDWPSVRADLAERGIVLRGGDADEAPMAYKRLPEVLAYHGDTIAVEHTLTPLAVVMAGPDIVDPYKD